MFSNVLLCNRVMSGIVVGTAKLPLGCNCASTFLFDMILKGKNDFITRKRIKTAQVTHLALLDVFLM